MANSPPFNPFLNCFSFPGYPPRPPSFNGSCKVDCVSKLTKSAHPRGRRGRCTGSSNDNDCRQPEVARKRNCGESISLKCPPLPPCSFKCIPKCEDLPAGRLRNVDILEELCYYTQGESKGEMDCYMVDCCGNVEKVNEEGCCCGDDDDDAGNSNGGAQPVKYSRRQRFSFNDKHPDKRSCADPWPFNQGRGHSCSGNNGARKGNGNPRAKPQYIGRDVKNETGNICCNRKSICCPVGPTNPEDILPAESGVYYYDQRSGAFVPEKELPRAPEVIQRIVTRSAVEDYELLPEPVERVECPPPTIQPIIQPIIMPEGQSNCAPPCGPCAMPPCNPCCPPPCGPCNPCNPCNPPFYNPCMPCGAQNPFMNMCGGSLPMVVPMGPQQDMMGMLPPFNPAVLNNFNKKKNKKESSGTGTGTKTGTKSGSGVKSSSYGPTKTPTYSKNKSFSSNGSSLPPL